MQARACMCCDVCITARNAARLQDFVPWVCPMVVCCVAAIASLASAAPRAQSAPLRSPPLPPYMALALGSP